MGRIQFKQVPLRKLKLDISIAVDKPPKLPFGGFRKKKFFRSATEREYTEVQPP